MADPYIDPIETKTYGQFAREQMAEVLLGLIPDLDGMIHFAISRQLQADEKMRHLLDNQPKVQVVDPPTVLDDARDALVRFGSHLDAQKGRPVDPKVFFRGEAPSLIARRRLTKLTAALGHIVDEFDKYQDKIRDAAHWRQELNDAHNALVALEKQQRASKVEQVTLVPEIAAEREAWLVTYNANKLLIRGHLAHIGKPELLPLIFDDLAEVHRAHGVTDDSSAAPPAPAPAPATPPTP